ncbi:MAG: hypothetical protein QXV82_10005 [Ignisphaera sp.]
MPLPATVTYNDANTPTWIIPIKENSANPYTLTITLESMDTISINETNLEAVKIDLQKAITDTGLSVADVNTIITFIRFTAPRVTVKIEGTGTTIFEIVMPPGVKVLDVVETATGRKVPFSFNEASNSVIFTVTFASIVELQILVSNIQTTLNTAVQAIVTVLVTTATIRIIMQSIREITEVVT